MSMNMNLVCRQVMNVPVNYVRNILLVVILQNRSTG